MIKVFIILFLGITLFSTCFSQVQVQLKGPDDVNWQTAENSIFISPNNSNYIIAGCNARHTSFSGTKLAVYISSNGGVNWSNANVFDTDSRCDPSVSIDRNGKYYVSYLENQGQHQRVAFSSDGVNWTINEITKESTDKNFLYIDNNCESVDFLGRIYNSWTENQNIKLSYSDDGGISWVEPITVVDNQHRLKGVNLTSDLSGVLYCSWIGFNASDIFQQIGCSKSTDGGDTWDPVAMNFTINGTAANCLGPSMTFNKIDEKIYLVWSNNGVVPSTNGGTDFIYLTTYDTKSITPSWSTPTQLNATNAISQMKPWISSDYYSNTVSCVYYNKINSTYYKTVVSTSTNSGNTWSNLNVNQNDFTSYETNVANDYIGISVNKGKIIPTWTQIVSGNSLSFVAPHSREDFNFPLPNSYSLNYYGANSISNPGSFNVSLSLGNMNLYAGNFIHFKDGFNVSVLHTSITNVFTASIPFCSVPIIDNLSLNGSIDHTIVSHTKIENNSVKIDFYLKSYPNPFNPTTTIEYGIPNDGNFKIVIYDILGREVKTLLNDFVKKGKYSVLFNNDGLNSGIYYCKISSINYNKTIKLLNIK